MAAVLVKWEKETGKESFTIVEQYQVEVYVAGGAIYYKKYKYPSNYLEGLRLVISKV